MNHENQSHAQLGKITGVLNDKESSETVFEALRSRGYSKDDIDVVMSDDTRKKHYGDLDSADRSELGDKAMEGAGVGSAIGGTLGAVVGAVAAIGTSLVLPGLGLVIAGPIAAALAGAGAGGLTGGLIGALVGSGIPEEHAKEVEQHITQGGIAIGVTPRSAEDATYIRDLLGKHGNGRVYDQHLRSSDPDYSAGHSAGKGQNPDMGKGAGMGSGSNQSDSGMGNGSSGGHSGSGGGSGQWGKEGDAVSNKGWGKEKDSDTERSMANSDSGISRGTMGGSGMAGAGVPDRG